MYMCKYAYIFKYAYICAFVYMDVCMCIYKCVCMDVCRNGGCIPWFLVHQGGSISSGRQSKPKTVLQAVLGGGVRVSLCLEDLCSLGLGRPRAVTPITVSERCFSESMGKSFFQIIQEKTESFRVPGKKDFMGIWDSREVSGPSGSCPCLSIVWLHQVTTVVVSMEK